MIEQTLDSLETHAHKVPSGVKFSCATLKYCHVYDVILPWPIVVRFGCDVAHVVVTDA